MTKPKKPLIVMKFGGSCIQEPSSFETIKHILSAYQENSIICVVSALYGITDLLMKVTECASQKQTQAVYKVVKQIENRHQRFISQLLGENLKEINCAYKKIQEIITLLLETLEEVEEFGIIPNFIDYIMSFGEKLSCILLHLYLSYEGYDSKFFFGEDFIITNNEFNNALPDLDLTRKRIENKMGYLGDAKFQKPITCITGFIGRNKIGYTTTLGRGGSDFTATILARCLYDLNWLNKGKIILWKDVAGILSGNPTYIQNPNLIKRLYYVEAKAIAALGAKVLNPKCLAIIEKQHIPVEIRKFEVPSADLSEFTLISQAVSEDKIKGISVIATKSMISIESPTLLMEPSFIATIFEFFASHNISSILCHESITQDSISFLIDEEVQNSTIDLFQDSIKLSSEWIKVHRYDVGVISLIIDQAYYLPIFNHITSQFIHQNISPISFSLSPTNTHISFIVAREDTIKIANIINEICKDISDTIFSEPIDQTPNVKNLEVKH